MQQRRVERPPQEFGAPLDLGRDAVGGERVRDPTVLRGEVAHARATRALASAFANAAAAAQQRAAGPGRSSTRARPFAAARSRISVPATRAQLRASFIVMTAACTDAGWLF